MSAKIETFDQISKCFHQNPVEFSECSALVASPKTFKTSRRLIDSPFPQADEALKMRGKAPDGVKRGSARPPWK